VSPGLRAVALVPARTLADAARTMAPGSEVSVAFETEPGARGAGRQERGGQAGGGGGGADREPRPAEGMISFGMGGRRLTARLIGGEFIRYRSRFPSEFGCRADVPAGPFTEAVRRVSLVADRASPVRLEFGSGKVVVEAQTEGRARAVETVAAEFHGDQPVISFNPHYLLDGLAAAAALGHSRPVPEAGDVPKSDGGTEVAGTGAAGTGAVGTRAGGTRASGAGPSGPGLVRLEFTSPAKPALITWAQDGTAQDGTAQDGTAQDGTAQDGTAQDGTAQDGTAQGSEGGDESRLADVPQFRYLVVPLRAAVRS
jgi:hypothetical protein